MKHIAIAMTGAMLLPGVAHAAGHPATAAGAASATVVTPQNLTHLAGSLKFGIFIPGSGGQVTVSSTSGTGATSGGVIFVSGSTTSADSFSIVGGVLQFATISTTGGTVNSGANAMSFTTTPSTTLAVFLLGGTTTFGVGGTLQVSASQAPGAYSGTYTVTVNYL